MDKKLIRLSKLMAQNGICSRREADAYIEKSLVKVDGKIVNVLGTKVPESAKIELDSKAQDLQHSKVTILLNKPIGYLSTGSEKDYKIAKDLITQENQDANFKGQKLKKEHLDKLAVVGRLDIDSKGLLVFSQDGTIAKKLIGENSPIEKEYFVRVEGKISDEKLKQLEFGLHLDGKKLKRAKVIKLKDDQFKIILKEGKKRQIRRMCELVDLKAVELKRTRTGKIKLGKLRKGKWRFLAENESF